MEPLFLKGSFQEKIWGGRNLKEMFNYDIPSDKTGELWAISAHPNGPATVINGIYKGKTLIELWDEQRELFGGQAGTVFPLLTKIIDAQDELSVQVHPDDEYGLKHEGELGKSECWYILAAEPGAQIVFGHRAETKEELQAMLQAGRWSELLRYVEVKAGDFFYLPSGTIHALGSGIMVLETQQSSDTTYRLYDYDRRDDTGKLRDLHLQESLEVATVPHHDTKLDIEVEEVENGVLKTLLSNDFFTVFEWEIEGPVRFESDALYTLVSVIEGSGHIQIDNTGFNLAKGDHFILPNGISDWILDGNLHLIASQP